MRVVREYLVEGRVDVAIEDCGAYFWAELAFIDGIGRWRMYFAGWMHECLARGQTFSMVDCALIATCAGCGPRRRTPVLSLRSHHGRGIAQ